jgi:hypothetical protein
MSDEVAHADPALTAHADIQAVQQALQNLRATLPPAQALVLDAVMAHAGDAATPAPRAPRAEIIFVGGRSQVPIVIRFDPAGPVSLNPQPIPPGRAGPL